MDTVAWAFLAALCLRVFLCCEFRSVHHTLLTVLQCKQHPERGSFMVKVRVADTVRHFTMSFYDASYEETGTPEKVLSLLCNGITGKAVAPRNCLFFLPVRGLTGFLS